LEGELLSLMAKARRDATGNLLPQLTALYDCPSEHTLKTRSNPITARRVFLSMLCGTTPKWLRKALTEDEAYGGFANRFIYAYGEAKDAMPYPPALDATAWERLKEKVDNVRKWAGTGEPQLDVDQAAINHFSTWYKGYHARASGDGILPALAVRFQSFAWKSGLLYAAQDQPKGLTDGHLTPALEVVDWLWESNRAAFVDLTQHGRELEDNIQGRLRASATRALSKRDLYRSLKISAGELERAIEPLTRLGVVQAVEVASHKGFQLID